MSLGHGSSIVRDGLVLHLDAANKKSYPSTGTVWKDLSGNGVDGVLINGPTFNSSNKGGIVFDGIDDYATISQRVSTSQFTYEAFLSSSNISKDQVYVGTTADAFYLRIFNSRAFLSISASGQRTLSHSSILENNKIYHIVSIYNGVRLKIYVNGILTEGNIINATMTSWGGDRIGRWRDIDQRSFVGNLYSLKAYNRELSLEEIFQNFEATRSRYDI